MRSRLLLSLVTTGALIATRGAAQDDTGAAVRDAVRNATRGITGGAYQGRGPEQTERFSRKVKIGRNGSLTLANISGAIVVTTAAGGDEVSIEAVKRTRGDRAELGSVQIQVDERSGRVEVRTEHTGRNDKVAVDFTVTVPADAAVDLRSISGNVTVTGVQGAVRAESVSGIVTAKGTPRLEHAKAVSGNVELTDTSSDGELAASSVSGSVRANGLKARALDFGTVSGDLVLTNVTADRVAIRSVSGDVEYNGTLARNGRYELKAHSGDVRITLRGDTGFTLTANTFSGSVRSEVPLTGGSSGGASGRDRGRGAANRAVAGTFGDGSAVLVLGTFSGDIVITKSR